MIQMRVINSRFTGLVASGLLLCFCSAVSCFGVCPEFQAGMQTGTIESDLVDEASGIAASRKNQDVFWTHNDDNVAQIFAFNSQGTHLGIYNLSGVSVYQIEDIAIGSGPVEGVDYLYIGNIGDNARKRDFITILRLEEPVVDPNQSPVEVSLGGVETLPMVYPDGPHDAETLLVDPLSGDIFIITRMRGGEKDSYVYRNPAPHIPDVTVTLELVATLSYDEDIKGGDISPAGDMVILRQHSSNDPLDGLLWLRPDGTALADVFSGAPCLVPLVWEDQGEAVCFDPDGCGYYTVGEGSHEPIYYYSRIGQCPEPSVSADFDGDGSINLIDLSIFAFNWQALNCGPPEWCDGTDMTRDGRVDPNDMNMFIGSWLGDP